MFNTDLVHMKVDVDAAEKVFKKAIKLVTGPEPKPGKECGFCEWEGKV